MARARVPPARDATVNITTATEKENVRLTNAIEETTTRPASADANMQDGMAEAMRLTRAGRLAEATALIQRTLGNPLGSSFGNQAAPEAPPAPSIPAEAWSTLPGAGTTMRGLTDLPGLQDLPGLPDLSNLPQISLPNMPVGRVSPPVIEPNVAPGPAPDAPATAGKFVSGSYTNGSGSRGYKLYIPSGPTGQPLPLLVMLHGCTQNAADFAAGTGMNALAESGKFLVVYPEQAQSANMNKCWNWFKTADQQRDRGEPSIVAGITRQISATYLVDDRRIYVAGMSAGAAMAVVMGATYPDLYAAVGVHSGLAYGAAHDMPSAFRAMQQGAPDTSGTKTSVSGTAVDLTRTVPTIVFHGDRDSTVNQRNGEQVLNQWAGANAAATRAASGDVPRVTVRQGQVPGGHAYTRSVYRDTDGQPVAEQWTIHGAGHAWAGGSPRGSYTDPRGPNASAEMVRFFLEHPRH